MPEWGFVIDQRKCIGCHACTVACKAENDVPVGNFRTWVKYVEKGAFPDVRRHFTVLRCNHCDAAPCVEICPVNALGKRPDAIVDLDRDLCIGCRACMQACPYDALYLNEDRGVAEKCHYCAHRTEVGLEPACVTVCPVQAIVPGDTTDPTSRISQLIQHPEAVRRKVEKGTKPRVWYVGALAEALVPGRAAEPDAYLWSDRSPEDAPPPAIAGFEPAPGVTTTLDVAHPPQWGYHVWLYLVTKNVAAGAALVAPFLALLGVTGPAAGILPEIVSLVFLGITNALLIHDLGRPERFWRILLTPNTNSWLVKGAWVLTAFGTITTAALGARLAGLATAADALRWINLLPAALASGYSAWLFGQCKGRDLWLDRHLFVKLVLRAALAGAGLVLLLSRAPDAVSWLIFGVLAALNGVECLLSLTHAPPTEDGRRAHAILRGLVGRSVPALFVACVVLAAIGVLTASAAPAGLDALLRATAVAASLAALTLFEKAWVNAGQAVPLS